MSYIEDRIANCERYIHNLQDSLCEMEEKHDALLDGVGEIYNRLRLVEENAKTLRHGYWIYQDTWGEFMCSNCGGGAVRKYPYCMWCGAKMRENNGED